MLTTIGYVQEIASEDSLFLINVGNAMQILRTIGSNVDIHTVTSDVLGVAPSDNNIIGPHHEKVFSWCNQGKKDTDVRFKCVNTKVPG